MSSSQTSRDSRDDEGDSPPEPQPEPQATPLRFTYPLPGPHGTLGTTG